MEKQNLDEFKKEFSEEIDFEDVSLDDLKKHKISSNVLESEVVLRKVFGDEIFVPKKTEEKIEGEKEIIKLSEEDIAFDSKVREICENLLDDNFEAGVSVLLSKVNNGENDEE